MKKLRLSLLAASAVCAVAASALTFSPVAAADGYREVTLTGTNVFYAGVGGATISAVRIDDNGDNRDYTAFSMGDGQTVTFRKNLAYNWWAADEDGFGTEHKFSMQIGFEDIGFESYVIKFQSQQYNVTDDGVSDNYLIFKPDGENLDLYISETEELAEDEQASVVLEDYLSVSIAFGDYEKGNYAVLVNGEEAGEFVNVRENYASYVSSGDSAATPITFTANIAKDAASTTCEMIMYSLNGQSFELYGAVANGDSVTGGVIHDDQAPVVCLDEDINYLTFGAEIDLDYVVIDVVATSPRTTLKYYVLSNEQYNSDEINYNDTSDESELFTDVSTSDNFKLLRDQYTYVPDLDETSGIVEKDGYKTYGLVKICLYVRDTSSSSAQTDYVFMDWYVPSEYVYDIAADSQEPAPDTSFIRVAEDKQGASYTMTGMVDFSGVEGVPAEVLEDGFAVTDLSSYEAYITAVEAYYQAEIDKAIAATEDGALYADSEENVFLPDFSGLVSDNLGGYTSLKYSIYYSASSTGSVTSLSYNELAFTASEADVTYRFTIYVTDEAGNDMRYPDENGEWQTIGTGNIWESEYASLLPFFEVTVEYKSATVEDPEEQSIGYVGSTYNSASFDITGVSGTYSTEYNLYIFDRDAYYADTGIELSYDDVVNSLNDEEHSLFKNARQYFTRVTSEEKFEDYSWNSSNVTFVPQSASEYYIVRLTLTDTGLSNQVTDKFLVVRASARAASIYGEDDWLENNLASIILFAVAGVCLVAFIVLLVIKPKDKGDIDVIAAEVAAEKQEKSKKKSNK